MDRMASPYWILLTLVFFQSVWAQKLLWSQSGSSKQNLGYQLISYQDYLAVSAPNSASSSLYVYQITTGELIWSISGETTGDYFGVILAQTDGILLVGAPNYPSGTCVGKVYAYNFSTGKLLWSQIGLDGPGQYFGQFITAGSSTVMIGVAPNVDCYRKVYTFNAASGILVWNKSWSGFGCGFSMKINDNNIGAIQDYSYDNYGMVSLYNVLNGESIWNRTGSYSGANYGYLLDMNDQIIAIIEVTGAKDGFIQGFVIKSNIQLWTIAVKGSLAYYQGFTIMISGDLLLFKVITETQQSPGFFCYDLISGEQLWNASNNTGPGIIAVAGDNAIIANFLSNEFGQVFSYDLANGMPRWNISGENQFDYFGSNILAINNILVVTASGYPGGASDGKIYVYDLSNNTM